jgi:hypothetical protein
VDDWYKAASIEFGAFPHRSTSSLERMRRLLRKFLVVGLLASPVCFADTGGAPVPTLGFFISGETGLDVLETIIPELARLNFAEATPRDTSAEHLPVVTFRRFDGDEIQVTAARQCVLVAFYGAEDLPGTNRGAFALRFAALHADLKKYLAALPQPRPVILEGEVSSIRSCPTAF